MNEFLDGPAVVEWLEGKGYRLGQEFLQSHAKLVHGWREGEIASVYDVDKVLTKLDLHLHLLPDELWIQAEFEEVAA